MEARDRRLSMLLVGGAAVAWLVVGVVALLVDPLENPSAGFIGATALGSAAALTAAPLFWLGAFARHRRIAYRGDWFRAARRGAWVGVVVAVFVVMRLNGIFELPIGLFLVALALVAELTLSAGTAGRG